MDVYKQYAKLKAQQKEVADKITLLEDEIFRDMSEKEVEQYKTGEGTFSITYRKTWEYPEEIVQEEEELKMRKKLLQKKLIAKPYANPHVRFLPTKDKEENHDK